MNFLNRELTLSSQTWLLADGRPAVRPYSFFPLVPRS